MTGPELYSLRYGYAMGSARKLAARLRCHPTTIYRNEKRRRISTFLSESTGTQPPPRFCVA